MRRLETLLVLMIVSGCASTGGSPAGAAPAAQAAAPVRMTSEGRTSMELAQGYLGLNQVDKAAFYANKAEASDPNSADVHALLGMIATRTGNAKQAGAEFDRALKLAPNEGDILNVYAAWLCETGQPAQADVAFTRALQDPNYRSPLQALANAGKCALGAGDLVKAENYFRRALELSPEDRALLFLMAETELRLGKIMEAQAFIQRRDDLNTDAQTLELAARIEDAAGNQMAAARYRKRMQVSFPDYVPTGEGGKLP